MGIFILGMHRSGTSAITRLITDMGAYAGPESLLLPADEGNPEGYWERRDVLAINRSLMKAQNCNWYQVDGFDSNHPLSLELEKPLQTCAKALEVRKPFVVKDPRFCLTLPYWLPYLGADPVIVLAIRHPSAIADSLLRRNQIPFAQGLALWERYISHALKHIQPFNVVVCDYDALMNTPEKTIATLHEQLRNFFPTLRVPTITTIKSAPQPAHTALSLTQQKLYEQISRKL